VICGSGENGGKIRWVCLARARARKTKEYNIYSFDDDEKIIPTHEKISITVSNLMHFYCKDMLILCIALFIFSSLLQIPQLLHAGGRSTQAVSLLSSLESS